jgi:hypothetical protein
MATLLKRHLIYKLRQILRSAPGFNRPDSYSSMLMLLVFSFALGINHGVLRLVCEKCNSLSVRLLHLSRTYSPKRQMKMCAELGSPHNTRFRLRYVSETLTREIAREWCFS